MSRLDMKSLVAFISVSVGLLTSFVGLSQVGSELSLTPVIGEAIAVNLAQNRQFDVEMSVTFTGFEDNDFEIELRVRDDVSWGGQIVPGDNAIDYPVGSVSSSHDGGTNENVYRFDLNPSGSESVSYRLVGFFTMVPPVCFQQTIVPINGVLERSVLGDVSASGSFSVRKIGTNSPSISLYAIQGQGNPDFPSTQGEYPYFFEANIVHTSGVFDQFPEFYVEYSHTELKLLSVSWVRHDHYSHTNDYAYPITEELIPDSYYLDDEIGTISFESGLQQKMQTDRNGYARFYFEVLTTGPLTPPAIGHADAEYSLCDGQDQIYLSQERNAGAYNVVQSQTQLSPAFISDVEEFYYCAEECSFDIGSFTSYFDFEADWMYLDVSSSIPDIRIQNVIGKTVPLELQVGMLEPGLEVWYMPQGGSTLVGPVVPSGNTFSFGSANPDEIIIKGYATTGDAPFNSDFRLKYTFSAAGQTLGAQDVFKLNYVNAASGDDFESTLLTENSNCDERFRLVDRYEEPVNRVSYVSSVVYEPGSQYSIRIEVLPREPLVLKDYNQVVFEYEFNDFMHLDGANPGFYGAGSDLSFQLVGQTTDVNSLYQNVQVSQDAQNPDKLLISFDYKNADEACTSSGKSLFLQFAIVVDDDATTSLSGYKSSVDDNGSGLLYDRSSDRGTWNTQPAGNDRYRTQIELLCPADNSSNTEFAAGSVARVRYVLLNETQNTLRGLEYFIPAPQFANIPTGSAGDDLLVRSQYRGLVPYSDVFEVANWTTAGLTLRSKSDFRLRGLERLTLEYDYRLQSAPASNQYSESFELVKILTLGGIERSNAPAEVPAILNVVSDEDADCVPEPPCETCVTSFSPVPGEEYLLGAWVKEDFDASSGPTAQTYVNAQIELTFNDGDLGDALYFKASGPIVDGWQRVEAAFVVPQGAYNIGINLMNFGSGDVFFDDVRVHPFRSNMVSYVYDPSTLRLRAQLDENNYATLYEYDDEGSLVRVKKETERGVYTIQETRLNQSKINK